MKRGLLIFRKYTLRAQIIVAFLAVTLLVLGLLATFYIDITRTALIGQANHALFAAASRTATSLDAFIGTNLDAIRTEATLPSVVAYMSLPPAQRTGSPEEVAMMKTLDVLRNENLFYISSYALLDKQGQNILDTNTPDIGQDESHHDYFQEPMRSGLPFVSSVEFAERVGGVYFYFSSPVRNQVGQIVGVLRTRYSVALLQELVSQSRGLAGEESFAILLDDNHIRLTQDAAPALIFKSVVPFDDVTKNALRAAGRLPNLPESELSTDLPAFAYGLNQATTQPFFAAEEQIGDGRLEQMAVVPLKEQPWLVVYMQPQEVFLSPIQSAIRVTLIWTLVIAILLTIAAIAISRWLTDPVAHLTFVAEQIAAGDLTAQARVESGDEIGRLALAFNNMTAQLRQTLQGLERREEALQESNRQLEMTLAKLQATQAQMVQQERMAAVGQMAAGIAHDFNNIMATVILYSESLLATGDLLPEDRKRVTLIQQQGQRAADLTQQILDFSRKSIMKRQDMDLWPFLVDMNSLLTRTLPENIRLLLDSDVTGVYVNADPARLQQVVLNLVINARNAMPDGGALHINLAATKIEAKDNAPLPNMEPGEWALLTISDTGLGIPDDILAHIFEPFFTTRAPLGSGLGLSQVEGIIKQHGGYISVDTQVGAGTTFNIYLPALPESFPDTAVPIREMIATGQGEMILLVEDDDLVRDALTYSLEALNYQVLGAANGREALRLYQQKYQEIDLVLSDLVMPELGGRELLAFLREENPSVKAIVLTGYPSADQEGELRLLGATGWCQKPVSLENLSRVVAQALHAEPNLQME